MKNETAMPQLFTATSNQLPRSAMNKKLTEWVSYDILKSHSAQQKKKDEEGYVTLVRYMYQRPSLFH